VEGGDRATTANRLRSIDLDPAIVDRRSRRARVELNVLTSARSSNSGPFVRPLSLELSMMKYLTLALSAAAVLTIPGAASAQQWQSINQRQANQFERIDRGIQNGVLTRAEANRIRAQFAALNTLERDYRRSNGLSTRERRDLDRRFDALSQRIQTQKRDRQDRRG
jgi:hypothetical protein